MVTSCPWPCRRSLSRRRDPRRPVIDEVTQVVMSPYQGGESGNVVAEVNLDDGDFEDHTLREAADPR